eukprot:CAMPEP_0171164240 /NCGR_PEP_ID=MMETSP0790-20130122/5566_1 /TAXON_ID=2925 /ORGANISM="Alexandrium catenella, Strain OF101" /LENGTH=552 /DNA_ID=CAMNT_0011628989 /DNA_START=181 /DNA_END=1836 /DNA_ORIENTATION=-
MGFSHGSAGVAALEVRRSLERVERGVAGLALEPVGVLGSAVVPIATLVGQEVLPEVNVHPQRVQAGGEVVVLLGLVFAQDPALAKDLHRSARKNLEGSVEALVAVVDDDARLDLGLAELGLQQLLPQPLREEGRVGISLDGPAVVFVAAVPVDLVPDRDEDGGVHVRAPLAAPLDVEVRAGHHLRRKAVGQVDHDAAVHRRLLALEDAPPVPRVVRHQALFVPVRQHQRIAEQGAQRRSRGVDLDLLVPLGLGLPQGGRQPQAPLAAAAPHHLAARLHLQPLATRRMAGLSHAEVGAVLDEAVAPLQEPVLGVRPLEAGPEAHDPAADFPRRRAHALPILGLDLSQAQVHLPPLPFDGGVAALLQGDVVVVLGHAEAVAAPYLVGHRFGRGKARGSSTAPDAPQPQLVLQVAPSSHLRDIGIGMPPSPRGAVWFLAAARATLSGSVDVPEGVEVPSDVGEALIILPALAGRSPSRVARKPTRAIVARGSVPRVILRRPRGLSGAQGVHPYVACTGPEMRYGEEQGGSDEHRSATKEGAMSSEGPQAMTAATG